MKIQPKLKRGKRKQLSSKVIKEIRQQVEYAAEEMNCSMSFIIAVALADFFGIKTQVQVYESKTKPKTEKNYRKVKAQSNVRVIPFSKVGR